MTRSISVKGIGKVSAKPNFAVLSLKLEGKDKDYDKAMEVSATQLSQLNESLVSIGFETNAVKTTNFSVHADYDQLRDEKGNYQRIFRGFLCSHQLKLSFDFEAKRLAQTLAAVSKCLANPELSVAFTVKDPAAINEALLREAAMNARKKAELLCDASGEKLGKLLTIDYNWAEINIYSDTHYEMAYYDCLRSETPMMGKSIDIEPNDIDVSDTATFVWEIDS